MQCAAQTLAGQELGVSLSALSERFGLSRPTLYELRQRTDELLCRHFEQDESGHRAVRVVVDESQLRRAVVALRVMGVNSIRAIEGLLPLLYPGVQLSYGKIQQQLSEAEAQAAQWNAQMDFCGVKAGALDEMFSQGEPVLAGVDLDSGALFSLQLCEQRDGASWTRVLEQGRTQGLSLEVVVKDAASGIAAGVSEVFPDAEQRDDCFHTVMELSKERRVLERRAYGAITREEEALSRLRRIRAREKNKRWSAKQALRKAQRECAEAVERFDRIDAATTKLRVAIECVDLERGQLHRPEQVQALIEEAADAVAGLDVRDAARLAQYLRNRAPGLALAQASLLPKLHALGEQYSLAAVTLGCVVWYLVGALRKSSPPRASAFTLSSSARCVCATAKCARC